MKVKSSAAGIISNAALVLVIIFIFTSRTEKLSSRIDLMPSLLGD